jgi:ParB-like chromosome segregation protein Spo0J
LDTAQISGEKAQGVLMSSFPVSGLHPHPSYLRHKVPVVPAKLAALAAAGSRSLLDPLEITREGTILDGYARWEYARRTNRPTLPCIAFDLSEEEALRWLLRKHIERSGLNPFTRVMLGLDLEPALSGQARLNQQAGGKLKGQSNLTEALRIAVRSKIAEVASVSAGNVSKVKQLLGNAVPEVIDALRSGEIKIHRGWLLAKHPPEKQARLLNEFRTTADIERTAKRLISRHAPEMSSGDLDFSRFISTLVAADTRSLDMVHAKVVRSPAKVVIVTEGFLNALGAQAEFEF